MLALAVSTPAPAQVDPASLAQRDAAAESRGDVAAARADRRSAARKRIAISRFRADFVGLVLRAGCRSAMLPIFRRFQQARNPVGILPRKGALGDGRWRRDGRAQLGVLSAADAHQIFELVPARKGRSTEPPPPAHPRRGCTTRAHDDPACVRRRKTSRLQGRHPIDYGRWRQGRPWLDGEPL
jgi:hypothetical protein